MLKKLISIRVLGKAYLWRGNCSQYGKLEDIYLNWLVGSVMKYV